MVTGRLLRLMQPEEAQLFSDWERTSRPYPWTVKQFSETLNSSTQKTWVLDDAGRPVGYVVIQIVEEEAYLLNIMVHPDIRRQGWGRRILKDIMDWAKINHAHHFFLDVDPANSAAVQLYQKSGFVVTARRVKAYPQGEDSVLMKKELQ